jgi:putative ABC transport system substrate-binding protein
MRRREFITLLGGAATVWPLAARAQQAGKLPVIGFLGADAVAFSPWTAAFVTRMRELGWIEGRTIAIEYRWSEGRPERYAEIAAEFVRLKVDVIVTVGSAVPTLKQATADIPIVFAVAIDPVGNGLVASLARPGGNVTGLSIQAAELAGKRLELLREVVPQLHRLAIMFDVGNPQPALEMDETQAAARTLGLEVAPLEIRRAEDIAPAFEALKPPADTLYVAVDQLVVANLTQILTLALDARLPTMFSTREFVKAGRSCPTDQSTRTCFDTRQNMWTRFCAGQSRAISRSSSRPNSSLSSISQLQRRLALPFGIKCSRSRTK